MLPSACHVGCRCHIRTHASLDKKKVNKVVLAYSGGLDTSVILKWLQETYDCEVVTFTADLGQVRLLGGCLTALYLLWE
jgi:predicted PP-loop superfamily ATPase